MRALHVPSSGEQPQLAELPVPAPGDGEVLLRVHAAGLNPLDNAIASGMLAGFMEHRYPLVLGRDASGVVAAVGDGVTDVRVGDAVIGHVLFAPPFESGTLAEYAVLPAASVAAKPAALDHVTAAALPLAGGAATAVVDAVAPQPGDVVLVNGASGGVGRYAVQLLAQRGAVVVATGTPADVEGLRGLGATSVVDFTAGPVAEQVRELHPEGVDALISLVGLTLDAVPLDAVRAGGTVSTTLQVPDSEALAARGLSGGGIIATPSREVVASLAASAARGDLHVELYRVLPLDQALDGLAELAAGTASGKIVIELDR